MSGSIAARDFRQDGLVAKAMERVQVELTGAQKLTGPCGMPKLRKRDLGNAPRGDLDGRRLDRMLSYRPIRCGRNWVNA